MVIHGFQKMTLLDFPGKVACTVFTAGCNFRCPFCHNAPLVTDILSSDRRDEDEIIEFLKKRRGLIDGVAITGGEPLMQPDIIDFIKRIRELGYAVKLDTNGSYPEKLDEIIGLGIVDYVAMDIKNSKEKYCLTAGISPEIMPNIEKSVKILLSGRVDYEFRTTVTNELHTEADIKKLCGWIKGAKRYFIQPFVDSGDLVGEEKMTAPDDETLQNMQKIAAEYVQFAELRGK